MTPADNALRAALHAALAPYRKPNKRKSRGDLVAVAERVLAEMDREDIRVVCLVDVGGGGASLRLLSASRCAPKPEKGPEAGVTDLTRYRASRGR